MPELTKAQPGTGGSVTARKPLSRPSPGKLTFKKVRELRKDPTVKLARKFIVGPALEAGWAVEADEDVPDEVREFVEDQLIPVHDLVMESAILGMSDFGWQAYELVWETSAVPEPKVTIKKFKSLWHDDTEVLVDQFGAFAGIKNRDVTLDPEASLLISQDVEGTNWYGTSDMEAVWQAMEPYELNRDANNRYDRRVPGTHFVIHYPPGTTDTFNGRTNVDNFEVANELLASLESSGRIAVPRMLDVAPELNDDTGWKIELLTDAGAGGAYLLERAKYLDTLKARAYGTPERSILEGEYGTKAEAETHGDIAVIVLNLRRKTTVRHINWHVVNRLLAMNFGDQYENKVRLVPNPLNDAALAYYRRVLDGLMAGQAGLEVIDAIDTDELLDRVMLPTRQVVGAVAPKEPAPPGPEPPSDPPPEDVGLAQRIKRIFRRA